MVRRVSAGSENENRVFRPKHRGVYDKANKKYGGGRDWK